jgi:hypothetical protein
MATGVSSESQMRRMRRITQTQRRVALASASEGKKHRMNPVAPGDPIGTGKSLLLQCADS